MDKTKQKNKPLQAEGFFPSESRWIYYRYWLSPIDRADIIGLHGGCEHSGRYKALGSLLAAQGYNFYVLDFLGHGRSDGQRGHVERYEEYLVDISNFYIFLWAQKGLKTPFLFGHSMGGLIAALFAAWGAFPIKGLILSSPLFRLKMKVPLWKSLMGRMVSRLHPTLSLDANLDPRALSHDEEVVQDLITDPLVGKKVSCRWFTEMQRGMKQARQTCAHMFCPCLVLHGGDDRVTDSHASQDYVEKISSTDKQFVLLPGFYHEVFNEQERDKACAILLDWLDQRSEKPPVVNG